MNKLDQEERGILSAFESGEGIPTKNAVETQQRHQEYAKAMLQKDARININQN
jgi:hypothetical protein